MFCLSPCKDTHTERRPPPTPPRRQPTPVAAPVAAVEPPSSTRWYGPAVAALVVAVACALLSPARAAGVAAAAVAIVLALRGPRKRRRPVPVAAPYAPPDDDALTAAFSLVLADATADPAARGWRLAEEERGVGRYLRDAAGGGRDAMSVGTVNASAETVDAALGRAAAQAPSIVEPLRESIRPLRCTEPQPALAEGWTPRGGVATAHIICKRVWPVSQRDMVLTTAAATRDGAFLRFATSTAHADAPLDADRVRLEVRGSGYLIEPRGASCKVTHVSCVAPGDAPAFLVNRLAWQRTAMVLKVRALVLAES